MAYQIDNSTAVSSMPTPGDVGPNPNGFFTLGTVIDADFLNALMMEVINVLVGAGITPDKTLQNQLLAAINVLISVEAASISANLDTNGFELISTGSNDILLNPVTGNTVVNGPITCTTVNAIDDTASVDFGSSAQNYKIASSSIMNITSSGLQLGSGARITAVDNDSTMAADSATLTPTQAAARAYAEAQAQKVSLSLVGFSDTAMSAGNTYYMSEGAANSSINAAYSFAMPFNGTISSFKVEIDTAPGSGFSSVYTLMNSSSATTQTCTIADTAQAGNGSGSITVAAGDVICLRCVIGAGATTANRTILSALLTQT